LSKKAGARDNPNKSGAISMLRALLPSKWQTEQLRVADSTLDEVPELQRINDAVPQTRYWMRVEGQAKFSMRLALQEGVLPPTPNRSKEYFRLQSIRTADSGKLIGFLGVYHGFPEDDIFWINTLTLHPKFQGRGYGPELLKGLIEIVEQLGSYTRMRSYVPLNNWRSLRLCVKVGLDRMVEIVGDKTLSDKAEAHVLLEKSLTPLPS
jgi:ribosomal protein S18 acetylase RimI-like enzyme